MNMALIRGSLLAAKELQQCVCPWVADWDFSGSSIFFAAKAVDVITVGRVRLLKRALRRAMMASRAFPGLVPPSPATTCCGKPGGCSWLSRTGCPQAERPDVVGADVGHTWRA